MVSGATPRGKTAIFAFAGLMMALAGCQSGNPLGALELGSPQRAAEPRPGQVTVDELQAYCPRVMMRTQNAINDTFQRGGDGDPTKLVHRASLSDTTRACAYNGGMLSITVAVAGRVVPGPAGSAGNVQLPLRLSVYRDTELVDDRTISQPVAITDVAGATQFVLNDTITMPNPDARNIRILVGFADKPARR